MAPRPKYDDAATIARMYAEAALAQTQEYVGALDQVEAGLPEDELERYEAALADQLREADQAYDEALDVDVIYDRDREEHVIPDSAKDHDDFYQELDDAYVALSAVIDALETVEDKRGHTLLADIELDRAYAEMAELDREEYEKHREAMGLERL